MRRIRKSFGSVEVLTDVDFDLYPGEVHILAGENGAGKSTLIKILGGVYTDHCGSVELNGKEVDFKSVQQAAEAGISIIHQELSLIGSLNIAENIFLGKEKSSYSWLKKSQMLDYAEQFLNKLGLDIDPGDAIENFSIGVQQMIEIAKALAFNSKIIVMDEPTSALTEPEVERLFDIIGQLKQDNHGIIYITHKMEEIYRIADRITVLRDGKYIGTETAENLPSEKLIQWMVGRELDQQFPRHISSIGDVRLEAKNIFIPGTASSPAPRVDGVSFQVRSGEILGIAGLAGSGSSELLNAIFGSFGPNAKGTIKIDSAEYEIAGPAESIKRGLALLTNNRKETGLVTDMNIVENTTLAALRKFSPACWMHSGRQKQAAAETAAVLNLKARSLFHDVDSLSGGNQQKVVMAKWMQTKPKIFLLDEPTRGVDVGAKHEIYELMNKWTKDGIAIVLITSEMPELLAMSDRIIVMHRGRITAEFDRADATQEKILRAALGHRKSA